MENSISKCNLSSHGLQSVIPLLKYQNDELARRNQIGYWTQRNHPLKLYNNKGQVRQFERRKYMQLAWKVDEGSKVRLKDYDPDFVDKYTDRALAAAETEKLSEELGELQQLLAAAHHHSLLIVLQGMDTSGKDGTIRQVMSQVNPLGCEVRSFKGPTSREQAHDFLWRIHRVVPGRGMISIFNRSHYEDVLVVRVHDLVPEK